MQLLGPSGDWMPLSGSQFLDASASTALTIPGLPTGVKAVGAQYVAILTAQTVGCYIRTDGQAVTAAVTGGVLMQAGDSRLVYGLQAMQAIRVIRSAGGGSLAVEYYLFRNAT